MANLFSVHVRIGACLGVLSWANTAPFEAILTSLTIHFSHKKQYQKMSSKSGPHFYICLTKLRFYLPSKSSYRGAWCSKFPAKNRSKRTFSEKMMFAILALVGWCSDPSWLILRGCRWQIKPKCCQKNVKMWTRFGAHFLVLFLCKKWIIRLVKMGPSPPVLVPDSTSHTSPSTHTLKRFEHVKPPRN